MTFEDYKRRVKGLDRFNDRANYLTAFMAICIGLFLFYGCFIDYPKFNIPGLLSALLFFFLGVYVAWRIPKQYEVRKINWETFPSIKSGVIEKYLRDNSIKIDRQNPDFILAYYTKGWLRGIELKIYVDGKSIYINAQTRFVKGPINFGQSHLAVRRLERYLANKL